MSETAALQRDRMKNWRHYNVKCLSQKYLAKMISMERSVINIRIAIVTLEIEVFLNYVNWIDYRFFQCCYVQF